jgi:hypothetical protein
VALRQRRHTHRPQQIDARFFSFGGVHRQRE